MSHDFGLRTPTWCQNKALSLCLSALNIFYKQICPRLHTFKKKRILNLNLSLTDWLTVSPVTHCNATVWVEGWCSWTAAPGRVACRRTGCAGRKRGRRTYSSDTWRMLTKQHKKQTTAKLELKCFLKKRSLIISIFRSLIFITDCSGAASHN